MADLPVVNSDRPLLVDDVDVHLFDGKVLILRNGKIYSVEDDKMVAATQILGRRRYEPVNKDWHDLRRSNLYWPYYPNKSSKFTGVSWSKKDERWMAYINIEGKQKRLGYFKTEEEAIQARKLAEQALQ